MTINTEPERLTREIFATFKALKRPHFPDVRCIDCGGLWLEQELKAQACPLCDGRVKDLS